MTTIACYWREREERKEGVPNSDLLLIILWTRRFLGNSTWKPLEIPTNSLRYRVNRVGNRGWRRKKTMDSCC